MLKHFCLVSCQEQGKFLMLSCLLWLADVMHAYFTIKFLFWILDMFGCYLNVYHWIFFFDFPNYSIEELFTLFPTILCDVQMLCSLAPTCCQLQEEEVWTQQPGISIFFFFVTIGYRLIIFVCFYHIYFWRNEKNCLLATCCSWGQRRRSSRLLILRKKCYPLLWVI